MRKHLLLGALLAAWPALSCRAGDAAPRARGVRRGGVPAAELETQGFDVLEGTVGAVCSSSR